MAYTLAQKILAAHLVSGSMARARRSPFASIRRLTQDATGTMAYLQFEAMGVPRVRTELSVSYVDHNMLQASFENADDHRFLQSIREEIRHLLQPARQRHLPPGAPGALRRAGEDAAGQRQPYADGRRAGHARHRLRRAGRGGGHGGRAVLSHHAEDPRRAKLTGSLSPWVAGKDVILELLRRLTVKGGVGRIIEYFGPGVASLSVPERATITNMGAELGATTSLFPADEVTREFLDAAGARGGLPRRWPPMPMPRMMRSIEIDLSALEPLVAAPHSPDAVRPVREVAGTVGAAGVRGQLHQLLLSRPGHRRRGAEGQGGASGGQPHRESRARSRCSR